jgi:hypothetical protein
LKAKKVLIETTDLTVDVCVKLYSVPNVNSNRENKGADGKRANLRCEVRWWYYRVDFDETGLRIKRWYTDH